MKTFKLFYTTKELRKLKLRKLKLEKLNEI